MLNKYSRANVSCVPVKWCFKRADWTWKRQKLLHPKIVFTKREKKESREHQRVNAVQINEMEWFKHSVNRPCAMRICLFANIWTGYGIKTMQTIRSFFYVWRTKDKVRIGLESGTKKNAPQLATHCTKNKLNHYILNIKQMPSFSTCISADSLVLP